MRSHAAAVGLAVFVLLPGCATPPSPARQALIEEFRQTVPTCRAQSECSAKWEAAQIFVARVAGYKVRTVTNVLIETAGPVGYSPSLAMQVVKEPIGGGGYRIRVEMNCANVFGCQPDILETAVAFNRYVNAAQP